MDNQFEFLVYRTAEEDISINAVVKDETIWLTQKAMGELFGVDKSSISRHLKNIFAEGELQEEVEENISETKRKNLHCITNAYVATLRYNTLPVVCRQGRRSIYL